MPSLRSPQALPLRPQIGPLSAATGQPYTLPPVGRRNRLEPKYAAIGEVLAGVLRTFVEETQAEVALARRQAIHDRLEGPMARDVARWFVKQGDMLVTVMGKRLGVMIDMAAAATTETANGRRPLTEATVTPSQWGPVLDAVLYGDGPGGISALRDIITGNGQEAYMAGTQAAAGMLANMGASIRFGWTPAEVTSYAFNHAAEQVTRITDTTRDELNLLIVDELRAGTGWGSLSKAIIEKYAHFAGPPLFPSHTHRSRAMAIAAYEIGDAFEGGQWAMVKSFMSGTGSRMEKLWLNAGDSRVRSAHRENAGDGWIPMDQPFSGDGALRPPTDPGCRCTLNWHRVGSKTDRRAPDPAAMRSTGDKITDNERVHDWFYRGQDVRDWDNKSNAKNDIVTRIAQDTGLPYEHVNDFIKQWAHSSNDDDFRSLSIQKIAAEEFGLPLSKYQLAKIDDHMDTRARASKVGRSIDPTNSMLFEMPHYPGTPRADVRAAGYDTPDDAIRAALHSMKRWTQAELEALGVTHITLYRGSALKDEWMDRDLKPGDRVVLEDNAIASYAIDRAIAIRFTGPGSPTFPHDWDRDTAGGYTVRVEIPIEYILGTARTGFGCLNETEFVVMGNHWEVILDRIEYPDSWR